jgi:hypothetical protein
VLLYGTIDKNGRSQFMIHGLLWPLLLSLFLDEIASSFASYMVRGPESEENTTMSDQPTLPTADAVETFVASLRQRVVPLNTIKSYCKRQEKSGSCAVCVEREGALYGRIEASKVPPLLPC